MRGILLIVFSLFTANSIAQKTCFKSGTTQICYQKFGEGNPVLIINGGPGMSSEGFIPLAELLSDNNTTIIYDQRGTGDSKLNVLDRTTISLDAMVEDIEVLRKKLGYNKWIVLGHSFGGMLAYAYAAKYPERINAMIQSHSGGMDLDLLNTLDVTSRLSEKQRDSLTYYSVIISQGDTSHATALKRGKLLAHAYLYNKKYLPQIAERLTQGNSRINSLLWTDMRLNKFDTKTEMKDFKKPVLILQGRNEVAPVSVAEKAHEVLPNSKLVIMDKCGHYGWLDRPDIYLSEVRNFLADNSEK